MFFYIDESGDDGDYAKSGSSRFFLMTAICFPCEKQARKCIKKIHSEVARSHKSKPDTLHAYRESSKTRQRFLKRVAKQNSLRIYVLTHDKSQSNISYKKLLSKLLEQLPKHESVQDIYVSQRSSKDQKFFRETDIPVTVVSVYRKIELQIPDFISWSVFRSIEHNDQEYISIIKDKVTFL